MKLHLAIAATLLSVTLILLGAVGLRAEETTTNDSTDPPASAGEDVGEDVGEDADGEDADGEDADGEDADGEEVLPGHSYHGETFNEGPRRSADLMDGMAEIHFPTSARCPRVQTLVEQGITQLHGFWYWEAERSFRQAATEDPQLAIAYWGMAMANANNRDRARGFIAEAMQRREENTTRREKLYIEALDRFLGASEAEAPPKAERAKRYFADLEQILHEFPEDLEAKALLAVALWQAERDGVEITSRYAVNALLGEIFDQQPMHPAHHYAIHLWDNARPANALASAALCGPAAPAIAHMWHMPGHIYSKLHRYADAAWQQEASARVDHAHMMESRLIPDQIHNFAHNNEWLIRNLIHVGRVDDALDQARNLVALPRHPQYNTIEKRGSYKFGQQRLLQVLTQFGLWQALVEEATGPYLTATGDEELDDDRSAWLGVAHTLLGNEGAAKDYREAFERRRETLQQSLADRDSESEGSEELARAGEKEDAKDEDAKKQLERLNRLIARIAAAEATVRRDAEALERHAKDAKLERVLHAQWQAEAGDLEGAVKRAERAVERGPGEVRPLAVAVDLRWRSGDAERARGHFEKLQSLAAHADLQTPMLARLAEPAEAWGAAEDWRLESEPAADLGPRPPLDHLGPSQWRPYRAPSWIAMAEDGRPVCDDSLAGKPTIVIFYLGFGCLHCVEQLHAFSPHVEGFHGEGIEMLAISNETVDQLQTGLKSFDQSIEFPLLANPDQTAFRAFGCWDDFEQQPLHGTFLIDGRGEVRWQDIGHEPFEAVEFLREEARRLLALP